MTPLKRVECEIEQRVLVNIQVDPDVAARLLPARFRPRLVEGVAIAGICLLWLDAIRPVGLPAWTGLRSANAAHRIAVEWDDGPAPGHGVLIPRYRHTDSKTTALTGGKVFPGVHERATITRVLDPGRIDVRLTGSRDQTEVALAGPIVDKLPADSVFPDVEAATAFFASDAVGWSVGHQPGQLDGVELTAEKFRLVPLAVETLHSSFFADRELFPAGSTRFDSALLMRPSAARWRALPRWNLATHRAA
jgi:hypothetical protein